MPLSLAAPRSEIAADPRKGSEAAREAARLGEIDKLAEILVKDRDPAAREAALTGLVRIGGEAAIWALVTLLAAEEPALRNAVIETLPNFGEQAINPIAPVLSDADPNLRIYALTVLQQIASPRAAAIALGVARGDPNVNVCAAAVEVVSISGTPDMAQALQSVPARFPDHPFLGFAVQAALEEIG